MSNLPGEVLPIRCDVSKESDVIEMFSVMRRTYGRLDILVNNAGMGKPASLLSGATQDWRDMFEVTLM